MPKTVVALFKNPTDVEVVVKQIEKLGIPKQELRTLEEPGTFPVDGVMSFTRLDFEVELKHALSEIGVADTEGEAYIRGLRNGDILVLASGTDQQVEAAAHIMNRQGAVNLEQSSGPEPELPEPDLENALPSRDMPLQTGHIRQISSGARLFVW
jgi:hypothetical protein